jgi:diacylglycerol kinase (ATP)
MRITLIHNPHAGRGRHKKEELMDALARSGQHVIYQSTDRSDYKEALEKSRDLVIAAGGDGTVENVASRLIGSGIALSVLPLGTANNLARSLGFVASAQEIIARLQRGKERGFDVELARGPWGRRFLFEGAGGGLLADYVRAAKGIGDKTKRLSKKQEMALHVSLIRRMVHHYPARKWKIEVDGEDISDRYILWEALNIRSVGPALSLAARASTKDGRFDLVCVGERDRSAFMEYLDAVGRTENQTLLANSQVSQTKNLFQKIDDSPRRQMLAPQKAAFETSKRDRNHREAIRANCSATSPEFERLIISNIYMSRMTPLGFADIH